MARRALTFLDLEGEAPDYPTFPKEATRTPEAMQEWQDAKSHYDAWNEAKEVLRDEIAEARSIARRGEALPAAWRDERDPRRKAWLSVHGKSVVSLVEKIAEGRFDREPVDYTRLAELALCLHKSAQIAANHSAK